MTAPPVSYLRVRDGYVGWQSWESEAGAGGPTILDLGPGLMISIEDTPDQPRLLRWMQSMAGIGRVIQFDPPGIGISDIGGAVPTFADWADAAVSVLDEAGADQVAVVAGGMSCMQALSLMRLHPQRVSSLVLINGTARLTTTDDYPHGIDPVMIETLLSVASTPGAAKPDEESVDLMIQAPSAAHDPEFRSWWSRTSRRAASPRVAGALNAEAFSTDMRPVLPSITVPTLVVARSDLTVGTGAMRFLADAIPGARYVELPGTDIPPFLGDFSGIVEEVREHLTGDRYASSADRVFAAVLFTDLVGSTAQAVRVGDEEWRALLLQHGALVRNEVARHGGRLVQDLGDGTLCTFPAPGAAIRCGLALVRRAPGLGVEMRAGVHAGEIEMRGSDLAGINVHTAARVSAIAEGGEVLVSSTVVDLVAGSPFAFSDRGMHDLKGVPGQRQVWAVQHA